MRFPTGGTRPSAISAGGDSDCHSRVAQPSQDPGDIPSTFAYAVIRQGPSGTLFCHRAVPWASDLDILRSPREITGRQHDGNLALALPQDWPTARTRTHFRR
jgi:hypothetical protein